MLLKIVDTNPKHLDLKIYKCGMENCQKGHFCGPSVRDHYLIHYVLDGRGTFKYNQMTYSLRSGDGFLIVPGKIAYYEADDTQPWSYAWVGFHGLKADEYLHYAGLTFENPLFHYSQDSQLSNYFSQMVDSRELKMCGEIRRIGLLYLLLSCLVENTKVLPSPIFDQKESYVKHALESIHVNYSTKIIVAELASSLGLNRSYLTSLFQRYLNISPQQYILKLRMEKACELMQDKSLSIGDISRSVGYDDPLLFSKLFKRVKGRCPREMREQYYSELP